MADTQNSPATQPLPGSEQEAAEAFLRAWEPEEETPVEEEASADDVEESTEETQDESSEEVESELEEPTEEEEDGEVEESEEEESDEVADEERLYEVTVDGERSEVSLDELRKGYSRQSDYTRKTQELAEQRRKVEALAEQAQQEMYQTQQFRQQYIDAATAVVQQQYGRINDLKNKTDWERLKVEDREEYLIKSQELTQLERQMKDEQDRIYSAQEEAQYENHQVMARAAQEERRKMEAIIPEWKNPEFRKSVGKEIVDFAMTQGFTEDEMRNLIDHRSLLLLMQAKAFQEMRQAQEKAKTKKVVKKPKMVKSGSGAKTSKETAKSKRIAQMKRLKETGSPDDAVSLFEDFVDL